MPTTFRVLDWVRFGSMVKKWSERSVPEPATVRDLVPLASDGVIAFDPGYDLNEPIICIRLPPASAGVNLTLPDPADIAMDLGVGDYPLPELYSRQAFQNADPYITDKEAFRNSRIADYCVSKCS
jgi:hypothetical protein